MDIFCQNLKFSKDEEADRHFDKIRITVGYIHFYKFLDVVDFPWWTCNTRRRYNGI